MAKQKIGIDVGGTNTDVVVLDQKNNVVAKVKTPTTGDITTGILQGLKKVSISKSVQKENVTHIMLGTTHCTNAIVQRKGLAKVASIRIGSPATHLIPPMMDWPEDLKAAVDGHHFIIGGGYEFDGRLLNNLSEDELNEVFNRIKNKVDAIAITGVFSQINSEQENEVCEFFHKKLGKNFPVSLSHEIGSVGILERENATILNAALYPIARDLTDAFNIAVSTMGFNAEIFFGQNDGTLMSVDYARKYPIFTIACGPTDSIRGAAFLSGIQDGIVIDVGGTTTDVGVLVNGFPRESAVSANISDVRTNFRMPDVLSIGLGGGTIIKTVDEQVSIGPESVGFKLSEEAIGFGGATATLTDIGILSGKMNIPEAKSITQIRDQLESKFSKTDEFVKNVLVKIADLTKDVIDSLKTNAEDIPVILVGGGSQLMPDKISGTSSITIPEHYEVANAVGVAIAQISGEVEKVYNIGGTTREQVIEETKSLAIKDAISAGADKKTIEVIDSEDIALAYLPNALKVKVKVAGDLLV